MGAAVFSEPGEVLQGEKVRLRPPTLGELSYVEWLWSDPETMSEVGGPVADFAGDRAQRWFARMVDPGCDTDFYCLIFSESDAPLGEISFHKFNRKTGRAVLNIKIEARYRGMGYGRDALLTFARHFFAKCGGKELIDDVAADNEHGRDLLIKFGFEQDPDVHGVFMARMTREHFLQLYGPGNPAS